MRCMICKNGTTAPGTTTITLEKNGATIVFQKVPALICQNCGEAYVEGSVTRDLLKRAEEIVRSGVTVDIRNYQLAAA